jgi:predicted enzyme related to lactoylglutathione lyase
MPTSEVLGRFVWHELMTSDPQAAAGFYKKVVGWKTQNWDKDSSYRMFVAKSGPVSGFMQLPEQAKAMGAPPNWMSYIGTPDVDATARRAAELGGRVLREPDDIPGAGRFAVLQDPQNAVFAAYTAPAGAPAMGEPGLGDFSWHELATSDLDGALRFYQALFGWEKTEGMDMGPMGIYQMFGWNGKSVGGMYTKPKEMPMPSHWLPYAMVADAKRAAAAAQSLGAKIINGPMEVPGGGWIAVGIDLQGAVFAVHSAAPAVKKAAAPAKSAASSKPKKKAAPKKAKKKATPKKAKKKAASKKAAARSRKRPAKKAARRRPVAKKAAKKKAARKGAKKKGGSRRKKR